VAPIQISVRIAQLAHNQLDTDRSRDL